MDTLTTSISVLGFVPALVVQYLQSLEDKSKIHLRTLPEKQSLSSVVMFADISGFTNLTETLSKIGPEGSEVIAFAINRYMELLVKGIGRSGGDIFKFAGDAMIVIWPPPVDDGHPQLRVLQTLCKSAIQSALDLQNTLNDTNILENIKLSVKIGFGIGEVNIIHVGGVFNRTEYIATGDPLTQAFESEHCAQHGGQTIISKEVYNLIEEFFDFQQVQGKSHYFVQLKKNYEKVRMKADALKIKNEINTHKFELMRKHIYPYIPKALLPYLYIDQERWSSELRRLSIMFVNLGIDLSLAKSTEGLVLIQKVIERVQKCIYMHEGSLNKLLMDDKGSTLIVVFGLPPMTHQDDSVRAVQTAFSLLHQLDKINCPCAVGISTGTVYAGVVGTSGSRREYSVLGDQVNLAARLMGTACTDPLNKIIICQETAQTIGHQISSYFLKTVMLKGKSDPIPLFIPVDKDASYLKEMNVFNIFPDLRTHRNNYSVFLDSHGLDQTIPLQGQKSGAPQLFMIGRDDAYRRVQVILDKFMKGQHKQKGGVLISIRGTYGSGKTLFVRKILHRIQEKLNSNQYTLWKYGEKGLILTSCVGAISHTLKLCGLKSILIGIFIIFAQRVGREPDEQLLSEMITVTPENQEYYETFKEVLDLKEVDMIAGFPPPPTKHDAMSEKKQKKEIKQLTFILIEFLQFYFEEVPEKFKDKVKESWMNWSNQMQLRDSQKNIKITNSIAPLVLCFDDTHHYDELSFRFMKLILKHFGFVTCITLIRDQNTEIMHQAVQPPIKGNEKQRKTQEENFIDGMASLERIIDPNNLHSFFLRGLLRNDKDDEFNKLIRMHFNISSFGVEKVITVDEEPKRISVNTNVEVVEDKVRKRGQTIIATQDVSQQENKRHELFNYFLFHENKANLFQNDIPLLFTNHVFLKSSGNPHIAINFIQQYINSKFLKIVRGQAIITEELLKLLDNEELILVDAPICRVQVNGPIIDKLSCLEQLIMKVASVIGDIFDVQTLVKIQPFKNVIDNEKLLKILQDLEYRDIIEVMEVNEFNKYYRFTHSFFRECLYQRMTYNQRRQLHKSVAEAIQNMPQVYESEEVKETKRLEFHWTMAETKWSIESKLEEKMMAESPTTQNRIFSKLKGALTSMQTSMQNSFIPQDNKQLQTSPQISYKAMRSIILKSIQNKLSRSNNDTNTIIKEGFLEKKSDQNITWAKRYCAMDGREFRYYYNELDAQNKAEPLSIIQLKHIYAIEPLDENDRINKLFSFQLSCTSWMKKSKMQGERKFYYAAENEESLEAWTIYIEFAKAKAVYDEFVNQFGKIQFPLGSQTDGFDQSIRFDVTLKRKPLNTQSHEVQKQNMKQSSAYRQSRASTFITQKMKFNSTTSVSEEQSAVILQNNLLDFELLKERVKVFLQKSTLLFYSHIFEMSIQRQDEYKQFGQPNQTVMKLNHLFKIEKKLLGQSEQQSKKSIATRSSVQLEDPKITDHLRRQGGTDSLQKMIVQNQGDPMGTSQFQIGVLEEIQEEEELQRDDEDPMKMKSIQSEQYITLQGISQVQSVENKESKLDSKKNSVQLSVNLNQQQKLIKNIEQVPGKNLMDKTSNSQSKSSVKDDDDKVSNKHSIQFYKEEYDNKSSPNQSQQSLKQGNEKFLSKQFDIQSPQNQSKQSLKVGNEDKFQSKQQYSSVKEDLVFKPSQSRIQLKEEIPEKPQSTTSNHSVKSKFLDNKSNYFPQTSEDPIGNFGNRQISGQHQNIKGDYDSSNIINSKNNSQLGLVTENKSTFQHSLSNLNESNQNQLKKEYKNSLVEVQSHSSDTLVSDQQNIPKINDSQLSLPIERQDNVSMIRQENVPKKKKQLQMVQLENQAVISTTRQNNDDNFSMTLLQEIIDKQESLRLMIFDQNQAKQDTKLKDNSQNDHSGSIQHTQQSMEFLKPVLNYTNNSIPNQSSSFDTKLNLQSLNIGGEEFKKETNFNLSTVQTLSQNSIGGQQQHQYQLPPQYTMQQKHSQQSQQSQYKIPNHQMSINQGNPYYLQSQFYQHSNQNPEVQSMIVGSSPQLNQSQNTYIKSQNTQNSLIDYSLGTRSENSPQPKKKKKKTKPKETDNMFGSKSKSPSNHSRKSNDKQKSYFGMAQSSCHSLSGDTFILKKGDKVIVKLYPDNPNYVICSLGQFEGVFEIANIKVLAVDKEKTIVQSKQSQNTQDVYQNLLDSKLNRSKTPNKAK